jgi:hypothetical protein
LHPIARGRRIQVSSHFFRETDMNRLATHLFAAAIACGAFAAHASLRTDSADTHITNGGTGFIGVTASAGMPAMSRMTRMDAGRRDVRAWSAPAADRSQERGAPTPALQTMGGNAMPAAPAMHRAWGTPD